MEMRDSVTEHERVHMLGAFALLQDSGQPVRDLTDGGRFIVCQISEP